MNRTDALENILDVDMRITYFQNVQSRLERMKNGGKNYLLMKKVIVHATTTKITVTKIYMHLWHVCMEMTNFLVEILVDVHN